MVIGAQNILGGFLIAIVNGNDAEFVRPAPIPASAAAVPTSGCSEPGSRMKLLDGGAEGG